MITANAKKTDLKKADKVIDEYDGEKSSLVMILQDIQQAYNYLPVPVLLRVSEKLDLPLSHVYSVATFYSSFSLKERGKHLVKVCDGTACHLRGARCICEEIKRTLGIEDGETTPDKDFSLEVVACLGACALAPVVTIGSDYQGKMTSEKIRQTLDKYKEKNG